MNESKRIVCEIPIETGITKDYSKFHILPGNRPVNKKHVNEIERSARSIGMLAEEIIVNENFEIIDGQHRFEAMKKNGMPIRYAVFKGYGVGECQNLNISQRNWTVPDYVNSYAEGGNINYIRLKKIWEVLREGKRTQVADFRVIVSIAKLNFIHAKVIKSGKLELTAEEAGRAIPLLKYMRRFVPSLEMVKVRNKEVITTIGIIASFSCVDKERLYKKIIRNIDKIHAYQDITLIVATVNRLYNEKLRKENKVNILGEWQSKGIKKP